MFRAYIIEVIRNLREDIPYFASSAFFVRTVRIMLS